MDINLSNKHEYNAAVENVFIRLLINSVYNALDVCAVEVSHTHLYNELFVCTANELSIKTDLGIITLSKGDAAIIPANIPHHKINWKVLSGWRTVGFFITKKSGAEYSNLHKKLKPLCTAQKPIVFRNVTEICERIDRLHKIAYNEDDPLPAIEMACILSSLAMIENQNNLRDENPETHIPDIYRLAWFEDLIANYYHEPLSTNKVAEKLHISSRHLSRVIKEHYGKTLHEILVKKRLDVACELLLSTDNSVNVIMRKVGYTNSSLFYKDFSARYGTTPTAYRESFL